MNSTRAATHVNRIIAAGLGLFVLLVPLAHTYALSFAKTTMRRCFTVSVGVVPTSMRSLPGIFPSSHHVSFGICLPSADRCSASSVNERLEYQVEA